MFKEANDLDVSAPVGSDICIIGAGAAGITLARELSSAAVKVVVLESGGLDYERETQSLYRGDSVGLYYFPLSDCRLRLFGGTTGHWGGACVPFDAHDFEQRDWVPHSGWPVSRDELAPYYDRAQDICGVGPFRYDLDAWSNPAESPALRLDSTRVETKFVQNSAPRRFGAHYREELRRLPNVDVILHANAKEIVTDPTGVSVERVHVATLSGRQFEVTAKHFVLASGGIENARILLLSDRHHPGGIGNRHDVVGRYFMDHIFMDSGNLILPGSVNFSLYRNRRLRGTRVRATLGLSSKMLAEHRLLNALVGLHVNRRVRSQGRHSGLRYLLSSAKRLEMPDDLWHHIALAMGDINDELRRRISGSSGKTIEQGGERFALLGLSTVSEQAPNPSSRVYLGEELDALGQRKLVLDWQLTVQDHYSVRRTYELLGQAFGEAGLGRVQVNLSPADDVWLERATAAAIDTPQGSFHHMGTTRMHASPTQGVVDRNLRVHGIDNLYVAGSSVFTTSGFANPTLTLVALACRLADHLAAKAVG